MVVGGIRDTCHSIVRRNFTFLLSLLPPPGELLSLRRHVELPTLADRPDERLLAVPSPPRRGEKVADRPDEGAWSSEEFATSAITSCAPTTPSFPCSRQ